MNRSAVINYLLLAGAGVTAPAYRDLAAQVQTRFGQEIPMRDGIKLAADMWLPEGGGRLPAILVRIPYQRNMALIRPPEHGTYFARHGYVWIIQDTRGRGDSEGVFSFFQDDAKDGYDTIEWIARQPWSNGDVCMMGASYLGTVQWLAAREKPPHLRCIAPAAAAGRWFEELPYIGGAFQLQFMLSWTNGTSGKIAQGGNAAGLDLNRIFRHRPLLTMDERLGRRIPVWRDFHAHPTFDEYWDAIQFVAPRDFVGIDLPVLHISGWFDWDQPGALFYWRGMQAHSPARDRQFLLVGPWTHPETWTGGSLSLGDWQFTGPSVVDYKPIYLAFFVRYLKRARDTFAFPRARIYFTGSNQWRDFTDYPPPGVKPERWYLSSGGKANSLLGDGRLVRSQPARELEDRFSYDPRNPVPSTIAGADPRGIDHRPIERRDDVLVYTSEELSDSMAIAGPVFVTLHAATDARDTDWTVKLLDVQPDGRALKLGPTEVGVIRARYREGYRTAKLLEPGAVHQYRIELFDIAHVFLPGHRIRLEIASSAFPFIDANPNTGLAVATDTTWKVANQTVYHGADRASFLELPMLRQ